MGRRGARMCLLWVVLCRGCCLVGVWVVCGGRLGVCWGVWRVMVGWVWLMLGFRWCVGGLCLSVGRWFWVVVGRVCLGVLVCWLGVGLGRVLLWVVLWVVVWGVCFRVRVLSVWVWGVSCMSRLGCSRVCLMRCVGVWMGFWGGRCGMLCLGVLGVMGHWITRCLRRLGCSRLRLLCLGWSRGGVFVLVL